MSRLLPALALLALAAQARAGELQVTRLPSLGESRVSVIAFVEVGSRDEKEREAGIAHYLEHCLLLSTEKRSIREIHSELRRRGVVHNGYTTREWTAYFFEADVEHADFLAELLGELLTHPRLEHDEVEAERGIVIEEIGSLDGHVPIHPFAETLYGRHVLARSVGGSARTLRGIGARDLRRFYEEHYALDRLQVAWSGELDESAFEETLRRSFAGLRERSVERSREPPKARSGMLLLPGSSGGGQQKVEIVAGAHVEPRTTETLARLLLLRALLDDELHEALRIEQAIAYYSGVKHVTLSDSWRLEASVKLTDPARADQALTALETALQRLREPSPSDLEIARRNALDELVPRSASDQVFTIELIRTVGERSWSSLLPSLGTITLENWRGQTDELLAAERSYVLTNHPALLPTPLAAKVMLVLFVSAIALWFLRQPLRRSLLLLRARLPSRGLSETEEDALEAEIEDIFKHRPRDS